MKDLHTLLINRRSIRRYSGQPVSADDVKLILEAGLLAPTSKNTRAWQFVVVDDKEMLARMSECKPVAAHPIAACSLAIVVAVDAERTEPWIEDASIAAAYMQLQAADLGLGSCWIQIRDRYMADGTPSQEYLQDLLKMPETMPIVCVLTIGHKDEERRPQDVEKLHWENVHIGQWRNDEQ